MHKIIHFIVFGPLVLPIHLCVCVQVCRDASLMSVRRMISGMHPSEIMKMDKSAIDAPIKLADFEASISKVQPSVGKNDLKKFEQWMIEFGAS